jgi:hypothetical protein
MEDEKNDLHAEMMARVVPVARAIIAMVADGTLPIGDDAIARDADGKPLPMGEANRPEAYKEAALRVMKLMLDADLKWAERHLLFQVVAQPSEILRNIVLTDLDKTFDRGLCKAFGVETFPDLSFKQVDAKLKEWHEAAGK